MKDGISDKTIVAVDGLVGTGKSTICRLASKRLGWLHLTTGYLYRAVAIIAEKQGLDVKDNAAVGEFLSSELPMISWDFSDSNAIKYRGENIGHLLTKVSNQASIVSEHPSVRKVLLPLQRSLVQKSKQGGAIVEGRDIGTVVFPAADVKIFLTANHYKRAQRRAKERGRDLDKVIVQIQERDARDSRRKIAPTIPAEDAKIIDTSEMSIEQTVEKILKTIKDNH